MQYKIIIGLTLLCLGTSCATMMGEKGKQSTYITTNVGEAKVFDSHNRLVGTTPLHYKPSVRGVEEALTIEKEGYKAQTIKVSVKEHKGYALLDAMLLCIPCIIDYSNGNIFSINQDSFSLRLTREYPKDVERALFLFNDVNWLPKDGSLVGYQVKEPVYFRKTSFDSYMYKAEVCAGALSSRYQVINCGSDEDMNKLLLHSNTIELTPVISNIKISAVSIKNVMNREISMDLVWKFAKRNGNVIKEIPVSLKGKAEWVENRPLIAKTLREGFKELMDNDDLYKLLLEESKTASGTVESVFENISLEPVSSPLFNRNKDLVQYLMKGVVTIQHDEGHGSGFLISKDGYVITNYHVIKNKKTVNIKFNESITLTADVVRGDDRYDVALLKINGSGFSPLEMINSDSALAGEDVFAIGTPEDVSLGQSVTKGVISGKRKIAEKIYIQTDVAINAGNSGGPLLNEDGKVIGMVTFKLRDVSGIGFCVPSNTIMDVLNLRYK